MSILALIVAFILGVVITLMIVKYQQRRLYETFLKWYNTHSNDVGTTSAFLHKNEET